MQRSQNRFWAFVPVLFSVLSGVMFLAILLLLLGGESYLRQFYQNRSLMNNLVLWVAALGGVGVLELIQAKWGQSVRSSEKKTLWLTRLIFLMVLAAQFIVARAC